VSREDIVSVGPLVSHIKHLLLVGFSPLLIGLEEVARSRQASVHLAFGPRQRNEWLASAAGATFLNGTLDSVMESDSFDDILAERQLDPSWLVVSMGAPFLFRERHLAAVSGQAINVHGAPLPEYRGGGGYSWRIMNGDHRGTVLIHQITPGIDDGPLLHHHDYEFPADLETPGDFQSYAAAQDAPVLEQLVGRILDLGELPPTSGQSGNATYFPRLATDIHGAVDWSWSIDDVVSFVRAFSHPYAGAFTMCGGERVRITEARVIDWVPIAPHPFMSGLIVADDNDRWIVAGRGGYVSVRVVSNGEKAPRLGDRLHTPSEWLEAALATRVEYLPEGLVVRNGSAPNP
jgi:methionyl-tRNA formyltransferase